MKVLVTGANGLLGTHVVKELTTRGVAVRALVRDRSRYQLPLHPLVEVWVGDLTQSGVAGEAIHTCTHVVHAAARTSPRARRYEQYYLANVVATKRLAESAAEAGVQRFVLVSTANTLGFGSAHAPGTERTPMKYPFTEMWYARSKKEAELGVLAYRDRLPVVVVHPTFLIGSHDAGSSSGQLLAAALGRRWIFYPPGGKNFVSASEAALAIVEALWRGEPGDHYLLAGENLSYRAFYERLCHLTGQRSVMVPLPPWLLKAVGLAGNVLRSLGCEVSFTSANVAALCEHTYYNNAKTRRALGVHFSPVNDAMSEAVTWFCRSPQLRGYCAEPADSFLRGRLF